MNPHIRNTTPGRATLSIATAVAVAATGLALVAPTATAGPSSEAAAPRAAGAVLPFTSVEAESATTDGTAIGPDHTQGTLASESSGRRAVQLAPGQSVEFTLPAAANAVNLAYSVPDGRSGTLAVYIDGEKTDTTLAVTSRYSYIDTPWIAGSKTHHLLDNTRALLGRDLSAGARVKFEASVPTAIDVADFEQVAGPAGAPSGAVSVVDKGADPSGQGDSTQAFREAIAAAKGGVVWIPPGEFKLTQSLSGVDDVELRGAGNWHSVVRSSRFIDQSNVPTGKVGLHDFAVIGEVTERVDSNPDNFVNGSLGPDSRVSGMWLQHLKVGLWLTGNNNNLVVEKNRILDMTADGLNLNGTANGVQVRENFLRNTGDDSLAMWSLNTTNSSSTFANNTVSQPNLANGIAIYGGRDITVKDNLVLDTNALGSGIAISNQKFMDPFFPLAGTITVSGNTLVRTGAMNPNWQHPMGALRVDSYDSAIEANVSITGTTVTDSPYSAFEFVSGGGTGKAVRNVTVDGASVDGVGTVVVQAETPGAVTFRGVTAKDVGVAGTYNCPYPAGSGTFEITDGGGNSGWDTAWDDCATWPEPAE
ncbi:glycosyl hydrolase family 28-related protein [Streptomyces sp. NPDC058653]|uniref:glycosyl hydrolase family 28-related protein n=1 Tax=Streptomyces sp. NPDC058653 TaxID=3346576 RepID=UPI00365CC331